MNSQKIRAAAILTSMMLTVLMTSCGGGGDEEGAPAALHLSADTVTFKGGDANSCGTGTTLIYIYGGAAPYRIDNTWPDVMTVSKTQVDHPGESFLLTAYNASFCVDPGTITVTDSRNRQVTLTVKTEVGS